MKLLWCSTVLFCGLLSAQQIQDYRYIAISPKLKNFSNNQYGLQSRLEDGLRKKNYIVLGQDRSAWPAEAAQNPCAVLLADLINSSSMLRNKISVAVKDCSDKTVASYEGASLEKEFETGYPDALNKALSTLPSSQPKAIASTQTKIPESRYDATTMPVNPPVEREVEHAIVLAGSAEVFTNGRINLNRITLSDGQFILANPNNSVPFAVFKQSGKPEIYHVKLQDGSFALGYFENGKIIIETPNADGTITRSEFLRR